MEQQREMLEIIYKSKTKITILQEAARFKNKSMDNKKKLSKAINQIKKNLIIQPTQILKTSGEDLIQMEKAQQFNRQLSIKQEAKLIKTKIIRLKIK